MDNLKRKDSQIRGVLSGMRSDYTERTVIPTINDHSKRKDSQIRGVVMGIRSDYTTRTVISPIKVRLHGIEGAVRCHLGGKRVNFA